MTKREVANAVADKAGMSRQNASLVVEAMLDVITETLSGGGSVEIFGFGEFRTKRFPARRLWNFAENGFYEAPARNIPRFYASSRLKRIINE